MSINDPNESQQGNLSIHIRMPYRILCNGVKREGVKASPDLASGLFCNMLLHKIRYGIHISPNSNDDLLRPERNSIPSFGMVFNGSGVTKALRLSYFIPLGMVQNECEPL